MPAPTSYTEETLANYMHHLVTHDDKVNELVSSLRWDVPSGAYDEAVNETLLIMQTDDITSLTGLVGIRQLRAVARMELWRMVVQRTVPAYQMSDQGATVSRNQIWEHAKAMFEMAQAEVVALGIDLSAAYRVGMTAVRYASDVYRNTTADDNEWSRVN